jgi:3-hydroxyisobutyrate dehydrogenase-like beta-hydroxyacid dehydrogenase
MSTIGLLHPGAMGASVGAALRGRGARVLWCAEGRSIETRQRAEADGLAAVRGLRELVAESRVIFSVCPPDAALDVARAVAAEGFDGLYVDANAVSRTTVGEVERVVTASGAALVDGGILGPPARAGAKTLLCLSGARASEVAALFEGSPLEASIVGLDVGQASALKMAFAAWSKGSAALLLAVRALAEAEGVSEALLESWRRLSPELPERSERSALGAAPKAWRWVGEMHEIAQSFEAAGLPPSFHAGAARIFERLSAFKSEPATFEAVLQALLERR